jgi:hypothetical protein
MRLKLIVVLLLTLTSASAVAQVAKTTMANATCTEYVKLMASTHSESNRRGFMWWHIGYLTALNVVGRTGFGTELNNDILKDINSEQIMAWMDNYCKNNPLSIQTDGATALAIELNNRNR